MPLSIGAGICMLLLLSPLAPGLESDRVDQWMIQHHPSAQSLRGLSVVDDCTIWASGAERTVLRSLDGGKSWQSVGPLGGRGTGLSRYRGLR